MKKVIKILSVFIILVLGAILITLGRGCRRADTSVPQAVAPQKADPQQTVADLHLQKQVANLQEQVADLQKQLEAKKTPQPQQDQDVEVQPPHPPVATAPETSKQRPTPTPTYVQPKEDRIAELRDDIADLQAKLEFRKHDRELCIRAAREAWMEGQRQQAIDDRKRDEKAIAQLEAILAQKTAELQSLLPPPPKSQPARAKSRPKNAI